MMSKKKEDFYITLLEYIHRKTGEGKIVESTEVYDHVLKINPTIAEDAIKRTFAHAVERVRDWDEGKGETIGFMLTLEAS